MQRNLEIRAETELPRATGVPQSRHGFWTFLRRFAWSPQPLQPKVQTEWVIIPAPALHGPAAWLCCSVWNESLSSSDSPSRVITPPAPAVTSLSFLRKEEGREGWRDRLALHWWTGGQNAGQWPICVKDHCEWVESLNVEANYCTYTSTEVYVTEAFPDQLALLSMEELLWWWQQGRFSITAVHFVFGLHYNANILIMRCEKKFNLGS